MTSHFPKEILHYSRLIRAGVILVGLTLAGAAGYFVYASLLEPERLVSIVQQYLVAPTTPIRFTLSVILVLAALFAINLGLMFNGLMAIWRLCNHLERGDIFASAVGYNIRQAGFYALACSISQFFSRILAVIAVTINNPPGQRQLAITISSDMAMLLIVSGLLLAMGHIMIVAAQIDEENKEFI